MDASASGRAPARFWLVSGMALLWMLFGFFAWSMELMIDEATLARMDEAQRQLHAARPGWVFGAYTVAIFSGLAGAIALLTRQAWATWALALSLAAVVIQFGASVFLLDTIEVLGPVGALAFPLLIFTVGAFLLWFSVQARHRGWIGR